MKTCTHRLYADGEWLVCDVCSADFPHQDGCPMVPCVCDLRGDFDFAAFSASNITDRVLDDMRDEMAALKSRMDTAEAVAKGNLASYREAARTLHAMSDAIGIVKSLHQPLPHRQLFCPECNAPHPCNTLRALEAL